MGHAATVLIADHDQSVVRLLKTVLVNAGHRVLVTTDSTAIGELVEEEEVELLLLDWDLDEGAGAKVARTVLDDHPDLVVAYLSTYGAPRSGLASSDLGIERFILKPFDDLASVTRVLKELLDDSVDPLEPEPLPELPEDHTLAVVVADTVEDDRLVLGEALEAAQCQVTYATCAQEALLYLQRDNQEVLVVGYDMGDMTADDVLLRAKRFDESVAVVVTAYEPSLAQTTSLLKRGASAFIEKPLESPETTASAIVRHALVVFEDRLEDEEEQDELDDTSDELDEDEESTEADAQDDEDDEDADDGEDDGDVDSQDGGEDASAEDDAEEDDEEEDDKA